MIVKSNEAQRRSFLGVDFVLLSHGPESMVTKMLYKKGDKPPLHKHPNEQSGYPESVTLVVAYGFLPASRRYWPLFYRFMRAGSAKTASIFVHFVLLFDKMPVYSAG